MDVPSSLFPQAHWAEATFNVHPIDLTASAQIVHQIVAFWLLLLLLLLAAVAAAVAAVVSWPSVICLAGAAAAAGIALICLAAAAFAAAAAAVVSGPNVICLAAAAVAAAARATGRWCVCGDQSGVTLNRLYNIQSEVTMYLFGIACDSA